MSGESELDDDALAKDARQTNEADPIPSDDSDVMPELSEFLRSTEEYFDRAGADGVYFYVARQAVHYAWRYRGPPSNTNRHKVARTLARFGHAALKAHRRGDSSLARQWWLDGERAYERLLLMSFANDIYSARNKVAERQRRIAQQPRKVWLKELSGAINQIFDLLASKRQERGFPSNGEVFSRIEELASLNKGSFEKNPDSGRIYYAPFVRVKVDVTERRVKEALKGKRKEKV